MGRLCGYVKPTDKRESVITLLLFDDFIPQPLIERSISNEAILVMITRYYGSVTLPQTLTITEMGHRRLDDVWTIQFV